MKTVIFRKPLKNRMSLKTVAHNISDEKINDMIAKGYHIVEVRATAKVQ